MNWEPRKCISLEKISLKQIACQFSLSNAFESVFVSYGFIFMFLSKMGSESYDMGVTFMNVVMPILVFPLTNIILILVALILMFKLKV